MLAEHLVADRGDQVEVFTSGALDALTWRDELPLGTETINGVTVHRIGSEAGRGEGFHPLVGHAAGRPQPMRVRRTASAGSTCRAPSRPTSWRAVEASDADVIAFYPYLYYPTIRGLPLVRDRAILHPAATKSRHCTCGVFDALFAQCRGFAFHTRSERRLVVERFGVATTPQVVVGLGIEEADGSAEVGTGCVRPRRRAVSPVHREGGRQEGDGDPLAVLPCLQGAPPRRSPTRPGGADRRSPRRRAATSC